MNISSEWKTLKPSAIADNPFTLIGADWMLVTAGTAEKWNTMTAAWGGMGFLWQKNVVFVFVRHSRYTMEFMEKNDLFTLSFLPEEWRSALNFCGTHSGRDTDKAEGTGLVPLELQEGAISFEQARLACVCRKIYAGEIEKEGFLSPEIEKHYPAGDYHRMYIGEVLRVLSK